MTAGRCTKWAPTLQKPSAQDTPPPEQASSLATATVVVLNAQSSGDFVSTVALEGSAATFDASNAAVFASSISASCFLELSVWTMGLMTYNVHGTSKPLST